MSSMGLPILFVNTRPSDRATILTQSLKKQAIDVFELPLLTLNPLDVAENAQTMSYQQRLEEDGYDALIIISPTAGEMGLAGCPQSFQPTCPVIAVGEKTAQVVQQAGWQVLCPTESNNEGMLRLPELATLTAGQRVLIWRGQGGRRLLTHDLQARGVRVDSIAWYQRACPNDLPKRFDQLVRLLNATQGLTEQSLTQTPSDRQNNAGQILKKYTISKRPVVLVSSGEAYQHWRNIVIDKSVYTLSDFEYLALGHRLSHKLMSDGLSFLSLTTLEPQHIFERLTHLR